MKYWQVELLKATEETQDAQEAFNKVRAAAQALGFEHCAYGLRMALPLSNPRTIILNDYPEAWRRRYAAANFMEVDPVVAHGRRSTAPLLWSEQLFASSGGFWEEARSHGLRHGWSQSCLDIHGVGGMLSLSRSSESLTPGELADQEVKLRWLVNVAHFALSRIYMAQQPERSNSKLTAREIEVLKWTADGKTSREVADLLMVSENTVNFHIKNVVAKLQTANKTAAVVRAAMLGLLF
jgi:LuxR family transcriptional regulator